uniref:Uncharacterized protein n=1 Tax=Anguilla anguilla TaxID=7936 RepID=A0A0E9SVC6_ANGAN
MSQATSCVLCSFWKEGSICSPTLGNRVG